METRPRGVDASRLTYPGDPATLEGVTFDVADVAAIL